MDLDVINMWFRDFMILGRDEGIKLLNGFVGVSWKFEYLILIFGFYKVEG